MKTAPNTARRGTPEQYRRDLDRRRSSLPWTTHGAGNYPKQAADLRLVLIEAQFVEFLGDARDLL